ncbi:MAG: hypothetical protein E7138_09625 [Rikenellaceae bacterium]|nr:hypothetical protein [Rikenellaceae bacterium]
MSEITTTPTVQLTKAQNIQDVEVALQQIAETANESLAAALNAQIQVLRYVQSPKLYDSSFDLLFANVRKAIKMTDSSKEREMIREKSVVMINNYIFFIQAKIDYDTAVQRSEYESLMEDAVLTLGESVADVATAAASVDNGVSKTAMVNSVVNSLKKGMSKGDNSLSSQITRWWNKEKAIKQKQGEFFETLYSLFGKLYKHRKLIGKSDIIANLIERYIDDVANHIYNTEYIQASINKLRKGYSITGGLWFIFVSNIIFCVWACRGCANLFRSEENEVAYSSATYWYIVLVGALILLLICAPSFVRLRKHKSELADTQQAAEHLKSELLSIAKAFEEGDEDYE